LAALDNGKYGVAFSSGLGVTTGIITMLESGDHIVAGDDIYGGTNRLFRNVAVRMGIELTFVDPTDLAAVENAITPKTKVVWMETPTNPLLKIADIKAISTLIKKKNAGVRNL
jgi:cystathionine gamma-lyase